MLKMHRTLQTRPATSPTRPNGFIWAGNVILVGTGDNIDRDLTDTEIRKVEERLGDYLPNWFDLPRSNVSCHVGFILSNMAGEKNLNDKTG
jgi:hypothetical protein